MPNNYRLAPLALSFMLFVILLNTSPADANGDIQALIHYESPENYHAMMGKDGDNGTLRMPYHFLVDYENHKLFDIPYTLVIGPYYGLPDTFHLGIRYEHEVSGPVYIKPGDNITLIGHFYDEKGIELENPYLEVIYNEPFEPGYPPTTTPAVTASTIAVTTTATTPEADRQLMECLAGGPCSSCPEELCDERFDPSIRFYPLSPYIDTDGKFITSLAFSSTDDMATILMPSEVHLNWSSQYHYLEIAEVKPPSSADGASAVGSAYELGPDDIEISGPLELSIAYDPAGLTPGATEEDLYMGLWNQSTSTWDRVQATHNDAENVIVAQLSHFSVYAVVIPMVTGPTVTTPMATSAYGTTSPPATTARAATTPPFIIITSNPDDTGSGSSGEAKPDADVRSFIYSAVPPVTIMLVSIAACIGIIRWIR